MSERSLTPEFRARADAVIDLLNAQAGDAPTGQVSASVMYAAARFNAFQVAATAESAEAMAAERDNAINHFVSQYRRMFEDHFDECIRNFDRYIGSRDDAPDH